ncbi:hypothetical protein C5167_004246 [Papaver somniferum]|nr:hypothetical protein C5167_004246 [Papaver somniferum]
MDAMRVVLTARRTNNEVQWSHYEQKKEKTSIWSLKGKKLNALASDVWSQLSAQRRSGRINCQFPETDS